MDQEDLGVAAEITLEESKSFKPFKPFLRPTVLMI